MKRFLIGVGLSLITGVVSCYFFFSLYGLISVFSTFLYKQLGLYAYLCNFSQEVRMGSIWSMDAVNFFVALLPVLFITGAALGNTVQTSAFTFSVLAFIGFYIAIFYEIGSLTLSRPIITEIAYAFLVLSCFVGFVKYGSRKRPYTKIWFQAVK